MLVRLLRVDQYGGRDWRRLWLNKISALLKRTATQQPAASSLPVGAPSRSQEKQLRMQGQRHGSSGGAWELAEQQEVRGPKPERAQQPRSASQVLTFVSKHSGFIDTLLRAGTSMRSRLSMLAISLHVIAHSRREPWTVSAAASSRARGPVQYAAAGMQQPAWYNHSTRALPLSA